MTFPESRKKRRASDEQIAILRYIPRLTHMKTSSLAFAALLSCGLLSSAFAQFTLTGTAYVQNFNSLSSGLPSGWQVATGATASSLGTTASFTNTATSWSDTGGSFKNFAASTSLAAGATAATQSASADRALGIRQTGTFGDPGAAIQFNFNSTGLALSSFSVDLMMLSVQPRSTTWSIQYGIGDTPTAFSTLGTYTDPGVFGSTAFSISGTGLLTALSNQSSVWIRFVALNESTGTGNRDSFAIDNFTLTYTAIPEPSTYTAIFGALALAGVIAHRRRRSC